MAQGAVVFDTQEMAARPSRSGVPEEQAQEIKAAFHAALIQALSGFATKADLENLETRLTAEMETVETRFTAELRDVETRFTAELKELETRFTAELKDVETRLRADFRAAIADVRELLKDHEIRTNRSLRNVGIALATIQIVGLAAVAGFPTLVA